MIEVLQSILQSTVDGIAVGSIIALAAVGLTLTYGILRLANFAHGDILTLGAYLAFLANTTLNRDTWLFIIFASAVAITLVWLLDKILLQPLRNKQNISTTAMLASIGSVTILVALGLTLIYSILYLAKIFQGNILFNLGDYLEFIINTNTTPKLDIWVSIAFGSAVSIVLVLLCEKVLWQPLRAKKATSTTMMIVSIGLALVIRNAIVLVWGAKPQKYDLPTFSAINIFGLAITRNRIVVIVAAIAVIAGLYYLLQNTKIGKAMRAVADNPELAKVAGINVNAVIIWTWVIAGSMTAFGGSMYGLITNLHPSMGWYLILPMFAAVILGGIGNPYGAIAGALIVGISQEVATTCPAALGELQKYCIGTEYKLGVGLLIMILVLLFRPQGLFKSTI